MIDTHRIRHRHPEVPSIGATTAGGRASAADFRSALATTLDAAVRDVRTTGEPDRHVVKAGETLYGIARAHLIAAGRAATPGASMRYALQIANANQIRNPDRIHPDQRLVLVQAAAPLRARNDGVAASVSGSTSPLTLAPVTPFEADEIHLPDDPGPPDAVPDTVATPADAVTERDATDAAHADTPSPVAERAAANHTQPERIAQPRVNLALYEQTARATTSLSAPAHANEPPDIVYKGVIGKALDLVPLAPATRAGLQQAGAVVGSSLAGRSLAMLTGLGGPVLTIVGLLWGIFSAQKIRAMQSDEPRQIAQTTAPEIAN